MKHTLLIITALMLVVGFSPGQEPIDESTLVSKDGLYYAPGSDKPYSGESVLYYESGQKMSEGTWKDGKEDGLWTWWHENGQKRSEVTYNKHGSPDGKATWYYENGQKMMEGTFKDGELIESTSTLWDEDGNEL
jgi:antitoxin component YwqK of YwqJK toxin-antitoxin module